MTSRACHRYDRVVASRRWCSVALAALLVPACTQTDPSARPTTSIPPAEVPQASNGTTPAIVPIAPTEPTGIPGLTAGDPFCSTWASYIGTIQVLGTAAAFGDLPGDEFATLELTAAPHLLDDAVAIGASWPQELTTERDLVIEQRIGPYARRAQRGVEALRDAGVDTTELDALRTTWEAALFARDPALPVIDIPAIAADLGAKLAAAGSAYNVAFTPFAQDPSLVVDGVATPATDAYLGAHCPDLASSGVGDAL